MNKGYSKFLQSKTWEGVRSIYYGKENIEKKHCFVCGSSERLNIHHLSYKGDLVEKTFGLTDPINMVILCQKCHLEAHRNPKMFEIRFNKTIHPITFKEKITRKEKRKLKEIGERPVRWIRIGDNFIKAA